jgi:heme oxygenase
MGMHSMTELPLSLTAALRERTHDLHTVAERSGIVNDILRKKIDRRGYAMLLRNLLPAYQSMEDGIERLRNDRPFDTFANPDLYRAAKIASDLHSIFGSDWSAELPLLEAGERYASHVAEASHGRGDGLIAHAYVRYFGDLSGGQVLKKMLAEALDLDSSALSFYDFPGLDPKALKAQMRDAIDADAELSRDKETILREGMRAFEHNIEISNAIQSSLAVTAA